MTRVPHLALLALAACGGTEHPFEFRAFIQTEIVHEVRADGVPVGAQFLSGSREVATFLRTYESFDSALELGPITLTLLDSTGATLSTLALEPGFCLTGCAQDRCEGFVPVEEEQGLGANDSGILHPSSSNCRDDAGNGHGIVVN